MECPHNIMESFHQRWLRQAQPPLSGRCVHRPDRNTVQALSIQISDIYEKTIFTYFLLGIKLIFDSEIIHHCLEAVLCGQTGVVQVTVNMSPILQSTVIEESQILCDDKRHDAAP